MQITLYENCALTNDYFDVLMPNQQELYLARLNKITVNVDNTYFELNGRFVFNLSPPYALPSRNFTYNYVKFEELMQDGISKFVRYGFIDDFEIGHGVVYVSFTEDVWANYASLMKVKAGILTRSLSKAWIRRNKDGTKTVFSAKVFELPLELETNNPVELVSLANVKDEFYVFASLQLYQLSQSGNKTHREIHQVVLGTALGSIEAMSTRLLQSACISLVKNAGIEKIKLKNAENANEWYYEIDNFIVINKEYIGNNNLSDIFTEEYIGVTSATLFGIFGFDVTKGMIEFSSRLYGIPYDMLNISVGTMLTQIPININGRQLFLRLHYSITHSDMKIFLQIQEQYHEVTSDFTYDIPITSLTADYNVQARISKLLNVRDGVLTATSGITEIAGGLNAEKVIGTSSNLKRRYGKGGRLTSIKTQSNKIYQNYTDYGDVTSGAGKVLKGVTDIVATIAPKYLSNKSNFITNNTLYSALYGLVLKKYVQENVINMQEFNSILRMSGYKVKEAVENFDFFDGAIIETNSNYDIVQFDTVVVFGAFSNNIKEQLEEILEKGIRYWINGVEFNNEVF